MTAIDTVDNDDFADVGASPVPEHQPGVLWLGLGFRVSVRTSDLGLRVRVSVRVRLGFRV